MNIWAVIEGVQGGAFLTHWEHTHTHRLNLMIFTQLFLKRNTSNTLKILRQTTMVSLKFLGSH